MKTLTRLAVILTLILSCTTIKSQQKVVHVWPGVAPGSEEWKYSEIEYMNEQNQKMVRNVVTPTLTVYLPDPAKATGAAVIVAPGGGFRFLSWQTEGTEVIYGRKDGMALTMIVTPPAVVSNGKGIIWVVSAGWTSDYNWIKMFKNMTRPLSDRGYTIFFVMHGSQPKYAVDEALPDLKKAIRFIRLHASDYGIDPSFIGISGASAGGHLSLLAGTTGDDGNPEAKEVVDKVSSRVQAVACFYPPTDLLNWKHPGDNAVIKREIREFQAPLDFVEWNAKTLHYNLVTDSVKRTDTGRTISPYYYVTADDAPSFIVHGDVDKLVPLYQSERMIEKLKEFNVPCELKIRLGGGHGFWNDMNDYVIMFADWFDKYLK